MTKILLINCGEEDILSDTNKGAEAVAVTTVELLRQSLPEAEIASFLNFSEDFARQLDVRVVRMKHSRHLPRFFSEIGWWFVLLNGLLWRCLHKLFNVNFRSLLRGRRLQEYAAADVIIYVGMDYYSEDISTRVVLRHSRDLWLASLPGKPVAVWAVSAGPFHTRLAGWAVRRAMRRMALVTVRDSLSRQFLEDAGVEPEKIHLTADPAFLLAPADGTRVDEILTRAGLPKDGRPVFCVNPSHSFITPSQEASRGTGSWYLRVMGVAGSTVASLLPESLFTPLLNGVKKTFLYRAVDTRYAEYKAFFAGLIDRLVEDYDATVLLVAHDQAMAQLFDDRVVTGEIESGVRHRDRVVSLGAEYSAADIKGIIGRCDVFIGARFHATIAALSQGVPSVCFPYYHKFALVEDLGMGTFISPAYTLETTLPLVDKAWKEREQLHRDLLEKSAQARELAALNGELVKRLVPGA